MGAPRSRPPDELAARRERERVHADSAEAIIPIFEERLELGVEVRESDRVRVRTETQTREVELEAVAAREHVEIERVPIDRYVERAPEVRVEGDVTVIPVLEEVVVLEKRLLLTEEVRVRKERAEEPRLLRVPVRRQQVIVEHLEPAASSDAEPEGTELTTRQGTEKRRKI